MTSNDVTQLKFTGAQKTLFPALARPNKFAKPDEIVPVPTAMKHKFLGRGDFAEVVEEDAATAKKTTKKGD